MATEVDEATVGLFTEFLILVDEGGEDLETVRALLLKRKADRNQAERDRLIAQKAEALERVYSHYRSQPGGAARLIALVTKLNAEGDPLDAKDMAIVTEYREALRRAVWGYAEPEDERDLDALVEGIVSAGHQRAADVAIGKLVGSLLNDELNGTALDARSHPLANWLVQTKGKKRQFRTLHARSVSAARKRALAPATAITPMTTLLDLLAGVARRLVSDEVQARAGFSPSRGNVDTEVAEARAFAATWGEQ